MAFDWASIRYLDGGTGSTLQDRGVAVNNPLWSSVALLDPAGLALNDGVHGDFAAAGAQILIANTHNLSLANVRRFLVERGVAALPKDMQALLAPFGGEERSWALLRLLNQRALESVRRAAPGVWVAACVASPDHAYATEASLSADEVQAAIRPQLEVLGELSPDLILFEMLTTASDFRGVGAALEEAALRFPIGVGVVAGDDGDSLGGVPLADAVELLGTIPEAHFIQCTRYDRVAKALGRLLPAVRLGGVYANDGRLWRDGAWHGERITPQAYAALAVGWRDQGARIIGGCCGTGPEHIAALTARLS